MTHNVQRVRVFAAATVAAFVVAACAPSPPPVEQMAAEVARLDTVVPIVEHLGVTDFENSPYCRNLGYARGAFGVLEEEGCDREGTVPFDAAALADHARIAAAVRVTGVATDRMLVATYDAGGELVTARFVRNDPSFADFWEYLYDPTGVEPKEDIPGTRTFTRIDDDWWFVLSPDD